MQSAVGPTPSVPAVVKRYAEFHGNPGSDNHHALTPRIDDDARILLCSICLLHSVVRGDRATHPRRTIEWQAITDVIENTVEPCLQVRAYSMLLGDDVTSHQQVAKELPVRDLRARAACPRSCHATRYC